MANTFSKEFLDKAVAGVKLHVARSEALNDMEDGLVKDWINELIEAGKSSDERLSKALKTMGNSSFNKIHI